MSEKKISLIVPVYYEEEVLPIAYPRMRDALQRTGHDYEILFVNDGSRDGTMRELRKIAAEDKRVKVLSFSRNFGHQLAVTAGMDEATGDALAGGGDLLQEVHRRLLLSAAHQHERLPDPSRYRRLSAHRPERGGRVLEDAGARPVFAGHVRLDGL